MNTNLNSSPSEWTISTCEVCHENAEIHFAYGVCEACLVNANSK
jgi:hypothetical protein